MFTCLARIEQKQAEQDSRLNKIESLLLHLTSASASDHAPKLVTADYEMPKSPEELEEKLQLGEGLVNIIF